MKLRSKLVRSINIAERVEQSHNANLINTYTSMYNHNIYSFLAMSNDLLCRFMAD